MPNSTSDTESNLGRLTLVAPNDPVLDRRAGGVGWVAIPSDYIQGVIRP